MAMVAPSEIHQEDEEEKKDQAKENEQGNLLKDDEEETTLSYILRYEQMIRQQDIEGTTTLSHILQLFRNIQRLGGEFIESPSNKNKDGTFVTFKAMKKTLELLKEDENNNVAAMTTMTTANENAAEIMTMMMSTDIQLMTMLSTLVQAHDDYYTQHEKNLVVPAEEEKKEEDSLSLAEFYHCYQIIMNAMQSLQVAAEPKITSGPFSFSTPNQDYPEFDHLKEGDVDELTGKILERTTHLIQSFFDPPPVKEELPKVEVLPQEKESPPDAPPTRTIKKSRELDFSDHQDSKSEPQGPNDRSRNLIFLGAMTLHVMVCAAGYWWSVNVYDVSTGAASAPKVQVQKDQTPVHLPEVKNNATQCLIMGEKHSLELEFLKQEHLKQLQEMEGQTQEWKESLTRTLQDEYEGKLSSLQAKREQEQKQYEETQEDQQMQHFWEVTSLHHQLIQSEMEYQQKQHEMLQKHQQEEDDLIQHQLRERQEQEAQIKQLQDQISPLKDVIAQTQQQLKVQQNESILKLQKQDEKINNLKVQNWMQRYVDEHKLLSTKQDHKEELGQERSRNIQELKDRKRSLENEFANTKKKMEDQYLEREQEEEKKRIQKEAVLRAGMNELEARLASMQQEKEEQEREHELVRKELKDKHFEEFFTLMSCQYGDEVQEGKDVCETDVSFSEKKKKNLCKRYSGRVASKPAPTREPPTGSGKGRLGKYRRSLWKDRIVPAISGALIVLIVPHIYTALGFGPVASAAAGAGAAASRSGFASALSARLSGTALGRGLANSVKVLSWMNLGQWNPKWKDMGSSAAHLWRAFIGV